MANQPFLTWAFPSDTGLTNRTLQTRMQEVINVKDYGAVGDGTTDDSISIQNALNTAFGSSNNPHGSNDPRSNRPVFFPAGDYKTTSTLTVTDVEGGWIFGTGRNAARIFNQSPAAGATVFRTYGMGYSLIENLTFLVTNSTGSCFDMTNTVSGSCVGRGATQSNTFTNCNFGAGAPTLRTAYGVSIGGADLNQGSEIVFNNCYFINCNIAGLYVNSFNALMIEVYGGNFAQCEKGIYCFSGSVPVINGVSFQNNISGVSNTYDIHIGNSVGDAYSIAGCRSESDHFLFLQTGAAALVSGCNHLGISSGGFVYVEQSNIYPGSVTIENSYSTNGRIGTNGSLTVTGSYLGNPNPFNFVGTGGNAEFRQSHIGGCIGQDIIHKRITATGSSRLYNIEAANVSSDSNFLWAGLGQAVTYTAASDVISAGGSALGLSANDPIFFETSSGSINSSQVYYVSATNLSATQFSISSATGSSVHNLTADSTDNTQRAHLGRTYSVGDQILNNTVAASSNPGWVCTTAGVAGSTTAVFRALAPCS